MTRQHATYLPGNWLSKLELRGTLISPGGEAVDSGGGSEDSKVAETAAAAGSAVATASAPEGETCGESAAEQYLKEEETCVPDRAPASHTEENAESTDATAATATAMTDQELRTKATAMLTRHEGRRTHVYFDTLGHPSIGIGFNLDRAGASSTIAAVGADYDAVRAGEQDLSEEQVDQLFSSDLDWAFAAARRQVQVFDSMHDSAKLAVVDMMFMGETAFSTFKKMIAALEALNYQEAADQIQDSKWYTQVGNRGPEIVNLMRSAGE
jgi:GH24 family phage-related lysozyme (muramidase)